MKKQTLISFIIPIYNVEQYLNECIISIVSEKSNDIEIILVDDESPDNCPKMCDEWANKDSRIKVIHKKNGGLSSARNAGLEIATGKYIAFVDGDDKLNKNSITKLINYLNLANFDICFMKINKFYADGAIIDMNECISSPKIKNKQKQQIIKYLSSRPKYPGSACSKIFNLEFLKKNNIKFPNDRRLSEDLGFVLNCLKNANSFDCLDFDYYEYRQNREGSITKNINQKNIDGLKLFLDESIKMLSKNNKPTDKISKYLLSFVAYEFAILMYFCCEYNYNENEYLNNYSWVLKYAKSTKGKIIFLLYKFLGLKITSKIIKKIKG